MKDWRITHPEFLRTLESRLGNAESCNNLIDSFEELMRSVWSFLARLLGHAGVRAVLARSIHLASLDAPLLQKVRVGEREVDFSEFRDYVTEVGCGVPEALDAFLRLGVATFQTLSDITGDTVTGPLHRHLESK